MGMALALQGVVEWLRDKNSWEVNQCGVQYDAIPAYDAGPFYVAVDDAGVDAVGNEDTDSLAEILKITIGIWRRPEHLMKDKRGDLKLPTDKYLIGVWTLHDLERTVLVHRSAGTIKDGLHGNWSFRTFLNGRWNLPHEEYGAEFLTPLRYRGKGAMQTLTLEDGGTPDIAWYGYRLQFRGLKREQKMRLATDAIG